MYSSGIRGVSQHEGSWKLYIPQKGGRVVTVVPVQVHVWLREKATLRMEEECTDRHSEELVPPPLVELLLVAVPSLRSPFSDKCLQVHQAGRRLQQLTHSCQ